jgi:hypothetical protein
MIRCSDYIERNKKKYFYQFNLRKKINFIRSHKEFKNALDYP